MAVSAHDATLSGCRRTPRPWTPLLAQPTKDSRPLLPTEPFWAALRDPAAVEHVGLGASCSRLPQIQRETALGLKSDFRHDRSTWHGYSTMSASNHCGRHAVFLARGLSVPRPRRPGGPRSKLHFSAQKVASTATPSSPAEVEAIHLSRLAHSGAQHGSPRIINRRADSHACTSCWLIVRYSGRNLTPTKWQPLPIRRLKRLLAWNFICGSE